MRGRDTETSRFGTVSIAIRGVPFPGTVDKLDLHVPVMIHSPHCNNSQSPHSRRLCGEPPDPMRTRRSEPTRAPCLCYSRSRLLRDSGSEKARLPSDGAFTLSRRDRTLFCRLRAKRARRIFHMAASLRLATLVRTAVMAGHREGCWFMFSFHALRRQQCKAGHVGS